MVRPLVGGMSKTMEVLGTSPLDKAEVDGGTLAFSAVLHQYGGQLDARVLLAMWVAGVTLPRVAEYLDKKAQAGKTERTVEGTARVIPNEERAA